MFKRTIALFVLFLTVSTFFCACVNITVVEKDDSSKKTETEASTVPTVSEETAESTVPTVSEEKEKLYTSSAKIIITSGSSSDISSDQLNSAKPISAELIESLGVLLDGKDIRNAVAEEYPDVEYECRLKRIGNTEICVITVTSQEKEHLQAICDKLADEFCVKAPAIIGTVSIKRLDKASAPTKVTED